MSVTDLGAALVEVSKYRGASGGRGN